MIVYSIRAFMHAHHVEYFSFLFGYFTGMILTLTAVVGFTYMFLRDFGKDVY